MQQSTADAASFLLFDGGYAQTLIDVGYSDARGCHDVLAGL